MKRADRKALRSKIILNTYKNQDLGGYRVFLETAFNESLLTKRSVSVRPLIKKIKKQYDFVSYEQSTRKLMALDYCRYSSKILELKTNLSLYRKLKKLDLLANSVGGEKSFLDSFLRGTNYNEDDLSNTFSRLRFTRKCLSIKEARNFYNMAGFSIENFKRSFDVLHIPRSHRRLYEQANKKYLKDVSHKPVFKDLRYYGVEIECIFPDQKAFTLFESLVENIPQVTIATDGSLRKEKDENILKEIKVLTDDSFTNLQKVCDALDKAKVLVNKSCGLHIHLDWRAQHEKIVERTMLSRFDNNVLSLVSMLVPEKRRTNTFCQKRISKNRYSYINLAARGTHNTIEVRLHSGTTNFTKIKNWIELWSYLFYSKRLRPFDNKRLGSFLDSLPNKDLARFYKDRARLFNKKDVLDLHGINNENKNEPLIEFNERDEVCVNF